MKSLIGLLSSAALLQHVAAQGAYLYTVDRSVSSSSTAMVDSQVASAIVARRRALTADRYLGIADEMLLQDINVYGGHQAPLFGPADETPAKLFIRLSDVNLQIDDVDLAMPDLWIQEPTRDLSSDFKAVADRQGMDGFCEYTVPPSLNAPNSKGVEVVFSYPLETEPSCLGASGIPNIPIVLSLYGYLPTKSSEVKSKLPGLIRLLKHFSATENIESTLLILPSKLSKPVKTHAARAAQETQEEPLDLPSSTRASSPETTNTNTFAASNTTASNNLTLPSIIPQCFASQSLCENTTNTCSGHGSCYKAHAGCFKCRCQRTVVRTNADGTQKTVQWGGSACEKKDVSVPFILFASFGVVMAALVAGAIGMLFNMGSQELPSVIGAGVAGPRAGK